MERHPQGSRFAEMVTSHGLPISCLVCPPGSPEKPVMSWLISPWTKPSRSLSSQCKSQSPSNAPKALRGLAVWAPSPTSTFFSSLVSSWPCRWWNMLSPLLPQVLILTVPSAWMLHSHAQFMIPAHVPPSQTPSLATLGDTAALPSHPPSCLPAGCHKLSC